MTGFHNVRLPERLGFGASGGPVRRTTILTMANGTETRTAAQRHSIRRYNVVASLKTRQHAIEIIDFFEARLGQLYAFRFRDPADYSSTHEAVPTPLDQIIGIGDGVRTRFQLLKSYGDDPYAVMRKITKPVASTVRMAVDGVEIAASNFTLDELSGHVTLSAALANGATLTAGFEFDVAVRFDIDRIETVLDDFKAFQLRDIPLVEVLNHG